MKTHTKQTSKIGVATSAGAIGAAAKSGTVIPAGTATVESLLREADKSYQSAFAKHDEAYRAVKGAPFCSTR